MLTKPITSAAEIGAGGKSHLAGWMPPLDGLRGLAILLVMLFHYGTALNRSKLPQHALSIVAELGWTGVDLFFVLSGFLITGILLDSRGADNYFSSFYFRRVLRIFPLYYFSLLLVFFLYPIWMPGFEQFSPPPNERIWYFAYAQNWIGLLVDGNRQRMIGHYWSLGIEEQFYMVWPWIVYKSTTKRVLQIATGGTVVSLFFRFILLAMHVSPEVIYRNTFARMDALLIGAACACLLRDPDCATYLRRYAAWMWIAPLVTLVVVREATLPFAYQSPGVQGLGLTAIALSFAALLVGVVLTMGARSMPQRFFCSGIMITFGKYSYAAYIWHQLVRVLVFNLEKNMLHASLPALLNIPLMIAATLVFSMASFACIERPFLMLKRYFKPSFNALPRVAG
jgi:peptidoglycan/LPS O-acetylase OafA/YrhL